MLNLSLGKKIEIARRGVNLNQEGLGLKINKSRNTISRWESGLTSPDYQEIKLIALATNKPVTFFVPDEEFLDLQLLAEVKSKDLNIPDAVRSGLIKQVPIVSWVNANRFCDINDPHPPGVADEYINTLAKGDNMFALRVKSDCMEPEFVEGDIIILKPDTSIHSGDYVIVKDNKNNEATFKQYKIYGDKVILHPLNPKYPDIELDHDERYVIVGKVVEKVKRYRRKSAAV
jgi:SOS-response transcriptional repressor LexA